MTERSAAESRQHAAEEKRRLETLDLQLEQFERDIAGHAGMVESFTEHLARAEQTLREHAASRETAQTALADKRLKLAERRAATTNIDREMTSLTARIEADQRRLLGFAETKQRLETRSAGLEREQQEAAANLSSADAAAGARKSKIAELEGQIAIAVSSVQALSGDQRTRAARLGELEQQHARLDSRRATLQEMIDARVGLGEAVKGALARREKARAAGEDGLWASIIGPLAELIEVEAEDAPAVEAAAIARLFAALGALVQGLVVPGAAALHAAREVGALGGRVTFLPVEYAESAATAACATPAIDDAYEKSHPVVLLIGRRPKAA